MTPAIRIQTLPATILIIAIFFGIKFSFIFRFQNIINIAIIYVHLNLLYIFHIILSLSPPPGVCYSPVPELSHGHYIEVPSSPLQTGCTLPPQYHSFPRIGMYLQTSREEKYSLPFPALLLSSI